MSPPAGRIKGDQKKKVQQPKKKKEFTKSERRQGRDRFPATAKDSSSEGLKPGDIPVPLQQLLLNVFKATFLWSDSGLEPSSSFSLSQNIQTIKAHLFRRDFASAFAGANDDLLKAYALRWSAGRALGYAVIFRSLCGHLLFEQDALDVPPGSRKHIVCIGGGAGAEVAALAAVWRELSSQILSTRSSDASGQVALNGGISELTLNEGEGFTSQFPPKEPLNVRDDISPTNIDDVHSSEPALPALTVTAVDIADWSSVLKGLSATLCSNSVPSTKSCPAPLLPEVTYDSDDGLFSIHFKKEDILNVSEEDLKLILLPSQDGKKVGTMMVTLMFTLNELFSTSMSKTVAFLLRLTDIVKPGTTLLVVDSPGSYSSVSLGVTKSTTGNGQGSRTSQSEKPQEERPQTERKYPMRFLLEHTLLSVAAGQWDCVLSDDSRWFRRNQAALRYDLGDGIGLEDMRYQIHVYRKSR
ncbi:hypothetical protein VTO42DRAFT_7762 [Malbranchea cinnamomea]